MPNTSLPPGIRAVQVVNPESGYYMEEFMFTRKSRRRVTQFVLACAGVSALAGVHARPVISEVLYDAAGTDNGNVFVELFGTPGTLLDGLLLEGVNGADGNIYRSVMLAGTIPPSPCTASTITAQGLTSAISARVASKSFRGAK